MPAKRTKMPKDRISSWHRRLTKCEFSSLSLNAHLVTLAIECTYAFAIAHLHELGDKERSSMPCFSALGFAKH